MHDRTFPGHPSHSRFALVARLGLLSYLTLLSAGCGAELGPALRAYEQARYPEAMDELRAIEAAAARWECADATRYALYRGLLHLALGDIAKARHWLGRVERATTADPRILSPGDAYRLASARAHLPH